MTKRKIRKKGEKEREGDIEEREGGLEEEVWKGERREKRLM